MVHFIFFLPCAFLFLLTLQSHQATSTTPSSAASPSSSSSPTTLEQAIDLYNNDHKEQALAVALLVIQRDPTYFHAYNFVGVVQHDLGDTSSALDYYEQAIQLSSEYHGTWTNVGLLYRQLGHIEKSRRAFAKALELDPTSAAAHNGMGLALHYAGKSAASIPYYNKALALQPDFAEAMYNKGVSEMHVGEPQQAAASYYHAIEMNGKYVEAMINLASIHHRFGQIEMARTYYAMALTCDHASIEDQIMSHTNMGVAYLMDYDGDRAMHHFHSARKLLEHQLSVLIGNASGGEGVLGSAQGSDGAQGIDGDGGDGGDGGNNKDLSFEKWKHKHPSIESIVAQLVENLAHFSKTRTALCDWELYSERLFELVQACDEQLNQGLSSALLPFDTLLLPVNPAWTLKVAKALSSQWENDERYPSMQPQAQPPQSQTQQQPPRRLKIGYISHDFNDHPTAHMVEGLFVHHDQSHFETYAYSYGKDDHSIFRQRIKNEIEHFVDIATYNYQLSAETIYNDHIDVLYDLQCHTRGNRVEIVAVRPSPIIVNFLIYPGAMGARWIDYLIGDPVVTPPEYASLHYRAKLVLLPKTYQVNYYPKDDYMDSFDQSSSGHGNDNNDDDVVRASIDARFETQEELNLIDPGPLLATPSSPLSPLSPSTTASFRISKQTFVFCNFNKNDKLDPFSFNVWMNILKQVPNSVLWMLSPSRAKGLEQIIRNLKREALYHGVHASRIIFAPRRTKKSHLQRFQHVDLFLDSFVYGAHSTATDALRGGVPVLTLRRNNFASRVATSLVLNVASPELATSNVKLFEQTAVQLANDKLSRYDQLPRTHEEGAAVPNDPVQHRRRRILRRLAMRLRKKSGKRETGTTHNGLPRTTRLQEVSSKISIHDADELLVGDGGLPLFNIAEYTRVFERASALMHEVRVAVVGGGGGGGGDERRKQQTWPMHIVVGGLDASSTVDSGFQQLARRIGRHGDRGGVELKTT